MQKSEFKSQKVRRFNIDGLKKDKRMDSLSPLGRGVGWVIPDFCLLVFLLKFCSEPLNAEDKGEHTEEKEGKDLWPQNVDTDTT